MRVQHIFESPWKLWGHLVTIITLAIGFSVPSLTSASATNKETRLVLHCPTDVPEAEALCAALRKNLQDSIGNITVHSILQDAELPAVGKVARLIITDVHDSKLQGYLEWRRAIEGASIARGPEIALDVMDAKLSAAVYEGFIQSLLSASPQIATDLSNR